MYLEAWNLVHSGALMGVISWFLPIMVVLMGTIVTFDILAGLKKAGWEQVPEEPIWDEDFGPRPQAKMYGCVDWRAWDAAIERQVATSKVWVPKWHFSDPRWNELEELYAAPPSTYYTGPVPSWS